MIGSNQSPGDVASPPPEPLRELPPAETPLQAPAEPAPKVRRPGIFRRTLEWFWRGRSIRAMREQGRVGSVRAQEFLRRGWVALELAERALKPTPQLLSGRGDGPARELARESLFWGLLAARRIRDEASSAGTEAAPPASLPELWSQADPTLLAGAAGGEAAVSTLGAELKLDRFDEFAELSLEEQARQASDLVVFARALLTAVEAPRVRVDKLVTQRLLRVGGALVLLALVGFGVHAARAWRDRERDLARGRPYKTSSVYPGVGCKSPEQDCPESPFYFFHTMDDDHPWVEIDLGKKQRFTAVRLVNREDCCGERAVPLAVQVSNDEKAWREVARRTEMFNSWYAEFPAVSARYVRVLSLHKAPLHLRRFSILR